MKNNILMIKEFETAEELFNKLHITGEYSNLFKSYIFRGHSSKSYKLIPSILRKDNLNFLYGSNELKRKYIKDGMQTLHITREKMLLSKFWSESNKVGLKVPVCEFAKKITEDSAYLLFYTSNLMEKKNISYENWLDDDFKELAVLAQHFDIPTRLLDWTSDPYVGLYFASVSSFSKESDDRVVLWALDKDTINFIISGTRSYNDEIIATNPKEGQRTEKNNIEKAFENRKINLNLENLEIYKENLKIIENNKNNKNKKCCKDYVVPIKFLQTPYYSNVNLKAQMGVLTYEEVSYEMGKAISEVMKYCWVDEIGVGKTPEEILRDEVPLDEIIEYYCKENYIFLNTLSNSTLLYKFTLPQKEGKAVLEKLHILRYDGADLFPGYYGVKKKIEELNNIERK